jgi:hypothetical protein
MRFGAHDNAIMRFGAQDNGIMKVPISHARSLTSCNRSVCVTICAIVTSHSIIGIRGSRVGCAIAVVCKQTCFSRFDNTEL